MDLSETEAVEMKVMEPSSTSNSVLLVSSHVSSTLLGSQLMHLSCFLCLIYIYLQKL